MDSNLSKTFDLLRFPLAVLVVYLHIAPMVSPTYINSFESGSSLYYYVSKIICQIAIACVPCFFLISAYLLTINIKRLTFEVYWTKLKSRFKTLFIPYILWNLLAIGYLKFTGQLTSLSFTSMFITPANFPLWFLRNLMVMVVCFPIFYWIAKATSKWGILFLSIVFILCPIVNIGYDFISISIYFFYCGISGGIAKMHLNSAHKGTKNIIIILFAISLLMKLVLNGSITAIINNCNLILGVATLLITAHFCVTKYHIRSVEILASSSFFIYASHKLGPTYLSKQAMFFLPQESYYTQTILFLVCPIITVGICVLIYYIAKRFAPQILFIFTGGK